MKSHLLIGVLTSILSSSPVVQSFSVVQQQQQRTTCIATKTRLRMQKQPIARLSTSENPLFLHAEAIHPHHDSVVRLDDPINIDTLSTTNGDKEAEKNKNESLHRFTQHVAPVVLSLYMMGHYLSTYHQSHTVPDVGGGGIDVDPMLVGCVLFATGLFMMTKWTFDQVFLSPM
mmetsp:Transcript_20400/g.42662  ORF Transcript_20400/g.42662 Transcript_20400/m.42662 type:complete len:173 (+) Transcript_20400:83-601(+)